MSEKSAQKRKYILKKAREVFSEKGFKNVTMKDVVEACDISRGGLYLYFSSTEEIFLAVLSEEPDDDDDEAISKALTGDATAGDMLALFLKEQKKEILRKKSLVLASYEYFAEKNLSAQDNPLRKQFEAGIQIVQTLIENGVRAGEFICADPYGCARNLMYVVEGLKVSAKTIGVNEAAVDRELLYILEGLMPGGN
ncbi:TetR/AcrR family transcriptional regulator [Butyrivibrio sp. WCD3002]|uniref:TetR/AcrR family transcriptional regulator n=1 Tax=Butyrivibrio sp. WCD3002 TaxID=1280676 RepID=UPI00042938D2|nr:TetR/AcrR family transcriptional regulator [Butyrivibrio sp. WCD3002]